MKEKARAILFGAIMLMIGLMSIKKLEAKVGSVKYETCSVELETAHRS